MKFVLTMVVGHPLDASAAGDCAVRSVYALNLSYDDCYKEIATANKNLFWLCQVTHVVLKISLTMFKTTFGYGILHLSLLGVRLDARQALSLPDKQDTMLLSMAFLRTSLNK